MLLIFVPAAYAADGEPLECRDRKAAREHFERGLVLYEKKKLEGALPEFRHSRENCPTENNTLNLALLLRDLGRPVEAIDILDDLQREFPVLQPGNEATAKALRNGLESIIGTVMLDGDYPGASIIIDAANVGTMPLARPLRLTTGMHALKVELAGYRPLDTSFVVEHQKNTLVVVALTSNKGPAPKPPPNLANHSLRFDAAVALSPTLGGQVTFCGECGGGPGLGTAIMGGYRHRLTSFVGLGAVAGYAFVWQHRAGRLSFQNPTAVVAVDDHLFMHAFFAAPHVSMFFDLGAQRFDVGISLGIIGGPLVNLRGPQDGVSDVEFGLPLKPSASFVGVMTLVQGAWHSPWRFLGKWPMFVTLGIFGTAPMNAPFSKDEFRQPSNASARPFGDRLLGSWVFTFTPGIAVEYDL
jgi:hypothetical protein